MANQNVEVVLRFAEGFKARDIDAIVEHVAEDCEVVALHSEVKGTFVGRDGVRRWVETFIETVPDVEVALERIITVDENRVLAFGTATQVMLPMPVPWRSPSR